MFYYWYVDNAYNKEDILKRIFDRANIGNGDNNGGISSGALAMRVVSDGGDNREVE